jgi:hypothetical protein
MTSDPTSGIRYLRNVLTRLAFPLDWSYIDEGGRMHGMSRLKWEQALEEAEVYLNLSNTNDLSETRRIPRRALVDTDPAFTQIGAHGLDRDFASYDRLFSYGENIHGVDCTVPTLGFEWLPTRQPVVLDCWSAAPSVPEGAFTTLVNWSAYGDHSYLGRTYGQKDRQFEPFFELPTRFGERMAIAANAPDDIKRRLESGGWGLLDAAQVSETPFHYQDFIASSRGEFCVAKHGYVTTRSGWFSDRSTAYLASGRPVVLEDTGFSRQLPTGNGLLSFTSHDEALQALRTVTEDYVHHCRCARAIAESYFDARVILSQLLEQVV